MTSTTLARVARRADRAAVVAGLAAVTGAAWILTVQLAAGMNMPISSMNMSRSAPAGPQFLLVIAMWAVMMVGMMVPSATPMVIAYSDWIRRGPISGSRPSRIASFVAGYVVVWLGFSLAAAVLQRVLEGAGLMNAMGAISRPALGGTVLVAAGAFQITPWKESCLTRCRTPVGFLIAEWRDGAIGGVVMGFRHGVYCLGCCWALMAVLFVVGTMNLTWMAVLGVFVLAEKVAPPSLRVSYAAAAVLVLSGGWMLATMAPS